MASNLLVLLIHIVVSWTFTEGQLVEEQRATCHNGMSIYRCTNNQSEFLSVDFELVSGLHELFSFTNLLTPEGTVRSIVVGPSPVIFNVTSSMESFISVTFTILNPVNLIGTTIRCSADTIQLNIISRNGNTLPTELRVLRNGSTINIDPYPQDSSLYYQLSPSSDNETSTWIMLNEESISTVWFKETYEITFSICPGVTENRTFVIGSCIFQDENQERNYTLLSDGNWIVFQMCPNNPMVTVTCMNGSWSENITCDNSTQATTKEETSRINTTKVDITFINTSSQSDTSQSDTSQSYTSQSDTSQSDTSQSDTCQSDTITMTLLFPIVIIVLISLVLAIINAVSCKHYMLYVQHVNS